MNLKTKKQTKDTKRSKCNYYKIISKHNLNNKLNFSTNFSKW